MTGPDLRSHWVYVQNDFITERKRRQTEEIIEVGCKKRQVTEEESGNGERGISGGESEKESGHKLVPVVTLGDGA